MYTIEEVNDLLDEIAAEIPNEFYNYLNGGILLFPDEKLHPQDRAGNLFTLGEYRIDNLGRYIVIYYGSFMSLYGYLDKNSLKQKLKETLVHEFTHHIESLAGEKGLCIKDAADIDSYNKRWNSR